MTKLEDFIYIKDFVLSPEICEEICLKYELTEGKHKGETLGGVSPDVKYTTDYNIQYNDDKWKRVFNLLLNSIKEEMVNYKEQLQKKTGDVYLNNELHVSGMLIQKYDENKGKYTWHNDQHTDISGNESIIRQVTFIFYLNDVEDGGETEFKFLKIKPKRGRLLFFPSDEIYIHRGNVPRSNDKYIITNWLSYSSNK